MRDERERNERAWRWTLRGVLAVALLTVAGFAVWVTRPVALDVQLFVHASDGSAQEVRLGGRAVGTTPLVLTHDQLRDAADPALEADYRALMASTPSSVSTSTHGPGSGGRAVAVMVQDGPGEPVWLRLDLTGTARDESLLLQVECGPPGTCLEMGASGTSGTRGVATARVTKHLEFEVP